ncbi:putative E3 ubiquitin-protein ligase HERC1 [Symbiodinium microadriaticum]|uniref:Putative E3 ubiquitin-protein ligase HERC1 n=1 Tax=Symbiodinium microadriaticum TaxID=2951 RepID=A0A1Q9EH25_SYMMI|nr:putative E3 ubiquitin-protein ligase HERC1 [Symbiodinium microadriaticum]
MGPEYGAAAAAAAHAAAAAAAAISALGAPLDPSGAQRLECDALRVQVREQDSELRAAKQREEELRRELEELRAERRGLLHSASWDNTGHFSFQKLAGRGMLRTPGSFLELQRHPDTAGRSNSAFDMPNCCADLRMVTDPEPETLTASLGSLRFELYRGPSEHNSPKDGAAHLRLVPIFSTTSPPATPTATRVPWPTSNTRCDYEIYEAIKDGEAAIHCAREPMTKKTMQVAMSNIQRGLSLKVGAGGSHAKAINDAHKRAPGPGAVRKQDWVKIASKWPKHRSTILHTDSARSYRTKIRGVVHDAVVHQKKKVLRGGKKFGSPPPSFAWQNNGCKITVKAGTQEIGRAWRFLKERVKINQNTKTGSHQLTAKIRAAQYEYWQRGKDMWASTGTLLTCYMDNITHKGFASSASARKEGQRTAGANLLTFGLQRSPEGCRGKGAGPGAKLPLELGNVLGHYWPAEDRLAGLYLPWQLADLGANGEDATSISFEGRALLSLSTVEHVGHDNEGVAHVMRAQRALGVGKGRLLTSAGRILDGETTLNMARLQNLPLTLHVRKVDIQATSLAFAAILGDGSVVSWGNADFGGDSSAVRDQLKNVQQIQATRLAFAAIVGDGSVVSWGRAESGGDSNAVRDQLKNVQQIQATDEAFAAILGDGSVVTWGGAVGGDSSAVRDQLKNVQQIQASDGAFAAILADGSVVTWGRAEYGGDSNAVQDQLKNVEQIQATLHAFAAILRDGSVVSWGYSGFGGDSSAVQDQLKNVQQIQANRSAFAAILEDGSVVTWGDAEPGGDSSAVQDQLKNVKQIQATRNSFAAILGNGSVVTWGRVEDGGDSSAVQDQLKNVQQIQATRLAFAAIVGDGSVVSWGSADFGGDSSAVRDQLKNVQHIQATRLAFAAIVGDGSVVTWGSSALRDQLKNVQQIQATGTAFAAILGDGSIVTWGDATTVLCKIS